MTEPTDETDKPSALPFETLDFIYTPSRDVAKEVAYFIDVLGGRLAFAIEGMGTRVAMVELADAPPRLLFADHVTGERPILIYRVAALGQALTALEARGWKREATLEIPPGPCSSFTTPGGHRIAVYERTRGFVEDSFRGRRDF
ncbi:MAG: hypothetical protein M3Y88_01850 [Chloroflexota bacterium]|nr:hypothetical protein [Chloroflexota bacterium]